jgi:hypothetical protein
MSAGDGGAVIAIHVWVGRHPNTSRYNDAASSPDERRPVRFYPMPAWRKPRRDIRGYTRISPAGVPSAAPRAHAGYANLTGNCWVAAEDGCPAGRMVAFARANEGEGGAGLRLRALSRFETTGVQMLNARNSMAAIPNTSTASATGSYSSQIRMINPTLPIARLH